MLRRVSPREPTRTPAAVRALRPDLLRLPVRPSPRVVILGCGFAGLAAARALARTKVRVTVIDRLNYHLFQPLLYEVATAGLSGPQIAAPIRHILRRQKNTTVLLAEALSLDADRRRVTLDQHAIIDYDYLIVATGVRHSYFGHPEWARHAPGLKTLDDALDIRRRVLLAFERAERESDPRRQRHWLTFVVIGAGATGVEMAGTLGEVARWSVKKEFHRFDAAEARVILIEAGERVLPTYPFDLSEKAARQLRALGVEVWTGRRVTKVDADKVEVDGECVGAGTLIWAAGIEASPLGRLLGAECDATGRVVVNDDLSVSGHPEIFVVGDLALTYSNGRPVPGVSPAAKQMGRHAAHNIRRAFNTKCTLEFCYRDYGSLAAIGRKAAIARVGRVRLWGLPAWLFWLFVHIYFLIGFRNRLAVMLDWAWAYCTFQRNARIIVGANCPDEQAPETRTRV